MIVRHFWIRNCFLCSTRKSVAQICFPDKERETMKKEKSRRRSAVYIWNHKDAFRSILRRLDSISTTRRLSVISSPCSWCLSFCFVDTFEMRNRALIAHKSISYERVLYKVGSSMDQFCLGSLNPVSVSGTNFPSADMPSVYRLMLNLSLTECNV